MASCLVRGRRTIYAGHWRNPAGLVTNGRSASAAMRLRLNMAAPNCSSCSFLTAAMRVSRLPNEHHWACIHRLGKRVERTQGRRAGRWRRRCHHASLRHVYDGGTVSLRVGPCDASPMLFSDASFLWAALHTHTNMPCVSATTQRVCNFGYSTDPFRCCTLRVDVEAEPTTPQIYRQNWMASCLCAMRTGVTNNEYRSITHRSTYHKGISSMHLIKQERETDKTRNHPRGAYGKKERRAEIFWSA